MSPVRQPVRRPRSRSAAPRFAAAAAALVPLAVATVWAALIVLARVTPALFPGQTLDLAVPPAVAGYLPPVPVPAPLKVEPPGPESVYNRPIVVLAVGVDSRPKTGDLAAVNTDTIMLANIDPLLKEVKVLSIPRDLLIRINNADGSMYEDRVNTSFANGAAEGGGVSGGMRQLETDLERALGIRIDYWSQVDFRGAARLFDAIGGIDVVVPGDLAIDEWWYSDDDENGKWLAFPPGAQHLNGYEAVAFARLREADDDLHRIRRQQLVLEAAVRQALGGGLLNDPAKAWSSYGESVRTNVPGAKVPGLALLARQTQGRLTTYSLADPVNGAASVVDVRLRSGAQVLRARPEALAYWTRLVFGQQPAEESEAVSSTARGSAEGGAPGP